MCVAVCPASNDELGPVRESGIHRTQCRLSLSSRVASVRYTLTQRGRGEHLFWKFTQTHNPHHLILDSVDTVVDPRRKGRYERWESRRSALASTACSIYSGFTDSHTFPTTKLCMCSVRVLPPCPPPRASSPCRMYVRAQSARRTFEL